MMTLEAFLRSLSSESALVLWAAIAALGASVSALAAAVYTGLTYRLVRLQSDPHVVVYTRADTDRPSIVNIVIENVGRDIAYDVCFHAARPIPGGAFGIDEATARVAAPMSDGPLIEGIPALGPSTTRVLTWGQYGGLQRSLEGSPLSLRYTYRSGRRRFSGVALLEVRSYFRTDASSGPMVRVARALENVVSQLQRTNRHLSDLDNTLTPRPRRGRRRRPGA